MRRDKVILIDEGGFSSVASTQWEELGYSLVASYEKAIGLDKRILDAQIDLLVFCIEKPSSNLLDYLVQLIKTKQIPIVIFTPDFDPRWMKKYLVAGVASYNCGTFEPIRIASVLHMAKLHFDQLKDLKTALLLAEDKLSNRVLVDKAKGMLMDYQNISEPQAYRALQKTAMDQATTIVDVARQTIQVLNSIQDSNTSLTSN